MAHRGIEGSAVWLEQRALEDIQGDAGTGLEAGPTLRPHLGFCMGLTLTQ